jgi:hypothetical protein
MYGSQVKEIFYLKDTIRCAIIVIVIILAGFFEE